jgi:hypothetical protein
VICLIRLDQNLRYKQQKDRQGLFSGEINISIIKRKGIATCQDERQFFAWEFRENKNKTWIMTVTWQRQWNAPDTSSPMIVTYT